MKHCLLDKFALELNYNESSNKSTAVCFPQLFELIDGVEYQVFFDDKEYNLNAYTLIDSGFEYVIIGNETLEENEFLPPFRVSYGKTIDDERTKHNIIDYLGKTVPKNLTINVELNKVNVILYNKKGNPVEYENVETISTDTIITDAQATFTRGTLMPPVEAELDMKTGNQIIDSNGELLKQVTILKPNTLIPENIKKNVEIGGVTGTFAGDEVEKTEQIDYSDYTPVYSEDEFLAFKKTENVGKIVRVMYEPGLFQEGSYLSYYKCILNESGTILLEKLKNEDVPIKNEYVILAEKDTVLTQVTVPKHENLISSNIKKNVDINGVTGSFIGNGYEYTENVLDFSTGKMVLIPDTDKQFSKITINTPPNLVPSNIKEGVSIAGVLGTYRLEGLPKLHPPESISNLRDAATTAPYIHVPYPVTNGDFVKECQLFALFETNEDEVDVTTGKLVAKAPISNMSDGAIFFAEDWLVDSLEKTSVLGAVFLGDNFTPSDMYIQDDLIVEYNEGATAAGIGITKVNYNVTNMEIYFAPEKIYWGQHLWTVLLPKDGFYLPKKIELVDTGFNSYEDNYDYDNQTGLFQFYYNRLDTEPVCFWEDEITFVADAPDTPWVNDFSILPTIFDGSLLSIPRCDPKAARADISKDGRVIYSIDYGPINKKELAVAKTYRTNYTTVNQQNGYGHTMRNSSGYSNAYHVYRCTFNCQAPTQVTINYAQYRYSSNNCGFISKLDTVFTGNTTIENSANCLFYGPGTSSTTVTGQSLTVDIPAGTHTLDFKWVGKTNSTSYYFTFAINFPETDGSVIVDLQEIPELDAPGDHVLSITGELEGHTGTDPVEVIYTRVGATVEGENLNTIGTVEDETLVINYVTVEDETIFYDPKEEEEVIT